VDDRADVKVVASQSVSFGSDLKKCDKSFEKPSVKMNIGHIPHSLQNMHDYAKTLFRAMVMKQTHCIVS
jgi:hypothetical protein